MWPLWLSNRMILGALMLFTAVSASALWGTTWPQDKEFLVDLFAVNPADWKQRTHWGTGDPCDRYRPWYGTRCRWDRKLGYFRIFELNLTDNNVRVFRFPESVGGLTKLDKLDLRNNKLEGTIPKSIVHMSTLSHLYLQGNTRMKVPRISDLTALAHLETLDISGLRITANIIPTSIARWTRLTVLNAKSCNLTARLPREIYALASLVRLDLSDNKLFSTVPDSLFTLQRLKFLDLSHNAFTGSVPLSVAQLSNTTLKVCDLSFNKICVGKYYPTCNVNNSSATTCS